jgi:hypothetical protein
MRNVRNLALASGAVIALAFGGIALAQETKQPETTAKPEQGQKHEHRGQHGGMHGHGGEKHEHGERC